MDAKHPTLATLEDGSRISGYCEPAYTPLLDAFTANFVERGEVGASLCAIVEGQTVIDVWGGWADRDARRAWQDDTMVVVYSSTKGMAALCVHLLVQDGLLAYDQPVEIIWPAFAKGGKGGTTVADMLDHRSPVPVLRGLLAEDAILDWDRMVSRVEAEPAFWEPGTRQGYHGLTYAWTVGQIVRTAAGKPLGEFFRKRVAEPLSLPFHIGLPAQLESGLARIVPTDRAEVDFASPFYRIALSERSSPAGLFLSHIDQLRFDTPPYHRAEIASANGIANGRGLASAYWAMIKPDGLLRPETIDRLRTPTAICELDEVLRRPSSFSGGFMKRMDSFGCNYDGLAIGDAAFGHVGMGGSIGFADPEKGFALGYAMNRLGPTILANSRGQTLVDTIYANL